jgi:3-isopropylmalate/(R)-2-methylmalate dehydratase small subunit
VDRLQQLAESEPTTDMTIDLVQREVRAGDIRAPFEIDDYTRWRLMEGLDDIGQTLAHADTISEFEQHRPGWLPTTA